jgi:hypothetical protein
MARPLFRPTTNHTCLQNPNPSPETVHLRSRLSERERDTSRVENDNASSYYRDNLSNFVTCFSPVLLLSRESSSQVLQKKFSLQNTNILRTGKQRNLCCRSRIRIFSIPDPGSEFFPSRIRIKEFKYFNPKQLFLSTQK